MNEPILMTPREVAEILRCSASKVYQMIARGELPVVRVRGSVRISRDRLLQRIEQGAVA